MRQLEGRVAIVTGAGRGIGQAVALRYAAEGARVVVNGRTAATIAETVQLITRQGGEAIAVTGDVGRSDVAERIAGTAADRWSRIDILVNNAAVIGPVEILGEEDVDQWMDTLRINVLGPFLMTRAVVPLMKTARRGKVIDVNSGANRGGRRQPPALPRFQSRPAADDDHARRAVGRVRHRGERVRPPGHD